MLAVIADFLHQAAPRYVFTESGIDDLQSRGIDDHLNCRGIGGVLTAGSPFPLDYMQDNGTMFEKLLRLGFIRLEQDASPMRSIGV